VPRRLIIALSCPVFPENKSHNNLLTLLYRFLDHYLQYVPVVDASLRPNECYTQSPFLFWTIVAIGSRKYIKDPTLILMLGPKVIELAQQAILTREGVLTTIQALVCLCSWPMPFGTLNNDITPMLTGAMLQLAMSIGLHVFGVGQDFSRTKLPCDRWQQIQRARLWVLCLTVSQKLVPFGDLQRLER
jgi:transcriptional regulatory protein LEU3